MRLQLLDAKVETAEKAFSFTARETFFMRLGFAVLVFLAIKWEVGSLGDADPKKLTGLAHWVNLNWLHDLNPVWPWQVLTGAGLALYVTGRMPVLSLLPALFFSVTIGTLANSQGAANHSTQLVVMLLLGQWLTYLAAGWQGGLREWLSPGDHAHRLVVHVSLVVFAAGYVVCGAVKLDNSNFHWIERVPSLALELQKSNWSEYYDTLTPVPAALDMVVRLMTDHPNLARVVFGTGLLIELAAFLALFGRRWSFFVGLAVIALHVSISRLMQLDFGYHIAAAAIFLVNIPGIGRTFSRTPVAPLQGLA